MRHIVLAVAASVILLAVGTLPGQPGTPVELSPAEREAMVKQAKLEPLKQLPGVFVQHVFWQAEGPSEENERLRVAVELRLRNNGIPLQTADDWKKTPGFPWLSCYVSYFKIGPALVARAFVHLQEEVVSVRTSNRLIMSTWENSVPRQRLVDGAKFEEAREWLLEAVDEFCNDYRAAHPKPAP